MPDTDFNPDWFSPPGDTIAEMLKERCLSLEYFDYWMDLSDEAAANIISGDYLLEPDDAEKLADLFGNTPEFWLQLEEQYRNQRYELESKVAT